MNTQETEMTPKWSIYAIFSLSEKKRPKKFSPRPRGKSVIVEILLKCMIKVAKVLFKKVFLE